MKKINLPPFSTAALLDEFRSAGVVLSLQPDGPRVRWGSGVEITPALVEEMKARRAEIVELLTRERAAATPLGLLEAGQLIAAVRLAGFTVALAEGGKVSVRGVGKLLDATVTALREQKAAIVRCLETENAQGAGGRAP